jgi:TonB-dependent receptor
MSGYAMVELGLTGRLRLIGGARVEDSHVEVNAISTLGQGTSSVKQYTDVLPSVALNARLTEMQSVRLSLTRTLARPEYRELADVLTRSVFNGENLRGNPNLVRTLITNADVRWEWFPNAGELLSVSLFGKQFSDPIEKVYRPSSNNTTVQFVNAESAINYGIELEARKGLGFVAPVLTPFTVFSNVTVMKSEIRLGSSEAASTNANRPMLGQSPYVLNGGLTWTPGDGRFSSTVLFNRVGERIVAAGERPLPDVKEQARNVLDLSLRFPVLGNVSGRVDARNLLDARYLTTQGTVTREAWDAGRVYQVGLSWKP